MDTQAGLNLQSPGLKKKARSRTRTPTVLQMEAVECGAAALAIVLGYHGLHLPLEQLRVACGVSRDGSKASNVVKAARTFGMTASGARLEVDALRTQAFPVIVFWNFNHFLVVEGFADDGVWLNDPASGPRKATFDEFDRAYTGVTLLIAPGPGFQKGGERRSTFEALKPRLDGSRSVLLFVTLASLALVIPGLAIPVFTQVFVDSYLIGQLEGWVKPLLLGMGITALLRMGLTWLQQHYLLRLELRLALTGSATFFWHVLRLPIEFFNQRHAGDISQRVGSNDRVARLLSGDLAINAVGAVTAIWYVLIMLTYDWLLTLIGVLLTGLNMAALKYVARRRVDGNMRVQQERGKLMAATMGGIQTIETIKATGGEIDFFARWAGLRAKAGNSGQQLELYSRMLSCVPVLLSTLTTASILGLGGWRVMEGGMTVGMLVAFQSLMGSFAGPVNSLMGLATKFQEVTGDLTRLDDVLRYPVDERFRTMVAADSLPGKLEGFLEIDRLSFGYSRLDPPLIEDFSLKLAPGQRVALVGESGSGKSTIARLVMGLNKPWSGEVRIDGLARESIAPITLNATLAGVDQEVYLFQGTVRDNLTLWDAAVPESDMVRAAHDALIHEVIASRPRGYDSTVGEGGVNFSGGQMQRLELARALTGNPRILVLDEATSALDPVTEKQVLDQLRKRGCTCLVVAHRLSTVRDCDEIIVMDRGKVIERGTHETLSELGGAYAKLVGTMSA